MSLKTAKKLSNSVKKRIKTGKKFGGINVKYDKISEIQISEDLKTWKIGILY